MIARFLAVVSKITGALFMMLAVLPGRPLAQPAPTVQAIFEQLAQRYDCQSFSCRFEQTSTLEAMEITDTASGRAYFKHPGKMRWEYQSPEPQKIISNGTRLWIYKPGENQVMVGRAPDFFKQGRGASFLTDIRNLRSHFDLRLAKDRGKDGIYVLALSPKGQKRQEDHFDFNTIYLDISRKTFDIVRIESTSAYGDRTVIELHDIKLDQELKDSFFNFDIPITADIVSLNQPE